MAAFSAEDAEVMALDTDVVRGQHAIEAFFKAATARTSGRACDAASTCGRWNAQATSAMC
jgi:hypothetical protein